MQANTDQQLIARILNGDTNAYGLLVDKYQEFVFTIAVRMLRVREEAEEVAQDSFIKAYQSLDKYRGDAKFSSWLYSIVYRKALDKIRSNIKHQTFQLLEEITEDETLAVENGLQQLETKERKERIKACIMSLSEIEAAIITLYYFDNQSVKEIASITQISEDNVKIKLYRSRKKLFNLLKQYVLPEFTNTNGKAI